VTIDTTAPVPAATSSDFTGISGFAVDVITALGEVGVGFLILLETFIPPIPSEIILALAGFLSSQGSISVVLVIVAATLGGYAGAAALYALGRFFGEERSVRLLARLPLVDREDFERSADWLHRHGAGAVFFGRLVPLMRSLISLPAGAIHMPFWRFSAFTIAGSAIWNTVLVLLGYAFGSQYELIAHYSDYLNYVVYAVMLGIVIWLVARAIRRRSRPAVEEA
jgi:membrane protein DedA with SNARE-associated domain